MTESDLLEFVRRKNVDVLLTRTDVSLWTKAVEPREIARMLLTMPLARAERILRDNNVEFFS